MCRKPARCEARRSGLTGARRHGSRPNSPADPHRRDVGAAGIEHDLVEDIGGAVEAGPQRDVGMRRGDVDHQRVEFEAGRELANRQAERFAAAGGGQPERFGRGDARTGHAARLAYVRRIDAAAERPRRHHGKPRAVEQRRRIAARNVGAEPDMSALVERGAQRKHGVGKVKIRQWAMRDAGAGRLDVVEVVGRNEVRMRKNGPVGEQAEFSQYLRVGAAETVADVFAGPVAFAAMRLHMTARLMRDLSQPLQQRVGATRHEAWRDRRMHQRPLARLHLGQPLDEAPGVGDRRICIGIAIKIRALRGIVHRHLADQCALAAVQADFGQRQIGLDMDGAEIDRRRRAVGEQIVDQRTVDFRAQIRCRRISPRAETCISAAIPRAARRAPCRAAPIAAHECAGRPCPAAGTGLRRVRSAFRWRALWRGSRHSLRGRCVRLRLCGRRCPPGSDSFPEFPADRARGRGRRCRQS